MNLSTRYMGLALRNPFGRRGVELRVAIVFLLEFADIVVERR